MPRLVPDGFDYVGDIYRPPMEAQNILIQATVGCSHGGCTFCSGYKDKRFTIKKQEVLEGDIAFAERYCRRQDRVFVLDGNALCMPMPRWLWLLENLREHLPWVRGAASFATAKDVAAKSDGDLAALRALGLDRLHVGVESGDSDVLRAVNKGVDATELLRQCRRVKAAGMELVVSVMVGIVNEDVSQTHARATGRILTAMNPDQVTVLTLIPFEGTAMERQLRQGELRPPKLGGILEELRSLYLHTELEGGLFDCSHSSGYLRFTARLPEERASGLAAIDAALAGDVALQENIFRHI